MDLILGIGGEIVKNAPSLIGFLMPVVVQRLNRDVPNESERFIVSVLACALAAGMLNYDKLLYGSVNDVTTSAGIIFLECQVMFKLYFKGSLLQQMQNRLMGLPPRVEIEVNRQ